MTKQKTMAITMLMLAGAAMASDCLKTDDATGNMPKAEAASVSGAAPVAGKPNAAPDKVVVYYFHGTRRCPTCLGIQKTIEQTIDDSFGKEVEAGLLVFEELNFEEEKNKPYAEKFQISFGTMIVAAQAGDKTVKWENADKVWDFAHAQDDLKAYVEKIVRGYLKLVGG